MADVKLFLSAKEAQKYLGFGEHKFSELGVPGRKAGKRIVYFVDDLKSFAHSLEKVAPCHSPSKGKARRSSSTTSRSREPGYEEVRRQAKLRQQKLLSQSSIMTPYLVNISHESRV